MCRYDLLGFPSSPTPALGRVALYPMHGGTSKPDPAVNFSGRRCHAPRSALASKPVRIRARADPSTHGHEVREYRRLSNGSKRRPLPSVPGSEASCCRRSLSIVRAPPSARAVITGGPAPPDLGDLARAGGAARRAARSGPAPAPNGAVPGAESAPGTVRDRGRSEGGRPSRRCRGGRRLIRRAPWSPRTPPPRRRTARYRPTR